MVDDNWCKIATKKICKNRTEKTLSLTNKQKKLQILRQKVQSSAIQKHNCAEMCEHMGKKVQNCPEL